MSREECFNYNNREVRYTIEKSRRTSIAISVSHRHGVRVLIPGSAPYSKAIDFVNSKREWIVKHLDRLARRDEQSPQLSYSDGDRLHYLGESHTLKIVTSSEGNEGVRLEDKTLNVTTREQDRAELLVKMWYYQRARETIIPIVERAAAALRKDTGKYPRSIAFKYVRSYWGICSRGGDIRFNIELVRMDPSLIEYIVVHELCHLVELNHSPRFHALVERYLPDYRERRKRVKDNYSIVM